MRDILDLTKFRLTALVALTTFLGMSVSPHSLPIANAIVAMLSIVLIVMGACALNCYIEIDIDGLMKRTENRPLPARRMSPPWALNLGLTLTLLPLLPLYLSTNWLTAFLGALSAFIYLFIYTPMKTKSAFAVYVGAIPGALPPLMGQVATSGSISLQGIMLFALLFWWQIPHFMAIAIRYREDYERAGILTFPSVYGLSFTRLQIALTTFITAGIGLTLPLTLGHLQLKESTLIMIIFINVLFFLYSLRGLFLPANETILRPWARKYFFSTLIYFLLMVPILV